MQDFPAISDLARHFLAVSTQPAAGGDSDGGSAEIRRLIGYSGLPPPPSSAAQQLSVKCPRCDSTNTKFCYYNNYNLAQPRHFCKACRRYWTKGGVLRNVPVGGGCRKSKRSSSSSTSKTSLKYSPSAATADKGGNNQLHRHPPSASRSSSDGSSGFPYHNYNCLRQNRDVDLINPTPTTAAKQAIVTPPAAAFAAPIILIQRANTNRHSNQSTFFDAMATAAGPPPCLQEALVTAPPSELLGFSSAGGLETVDWQGAGVEPTFFDLAVGVGAADTAAYWTQSQWADTDPSLCIP